MLEIPISDDIIIVIRPRSELARVGRLSPNAQLRRVAASIAEVAKAAPLIGDWGALALERCDPSVATETEELFLSYAQFCRELGVAAPERLTFTAFGRALTAMGWARVSDAGGRSMRPGCRLRPGVIEAAVKPDPTPEGMADSLTAFFAHDILAGASTERVKLVSLFDRYRAWAAEFGVQPLRQRQFVKAMRSRGFEHIRSNGMWWANAQSDPRTPAGSGISATSATDSRRKTPRKGVREGHSAGLLFGD